MVKMSGQQSQQNPSGNNPSILMKQPSNATQLATTSKNIIRSAAAAIATAAIETASGDINQLESSLNINDHYENNRTKLQKHEENRRINFITNKESATVIASLSKADKSSILLRDCSDETSNLAANDKVPAAVCDGGSSSELRNSDNRLNISLTPPQQNQINLSDTTIKHNLDYTNLRESRVQFRNLLASGGDDDDDDEVVDLGDRELKTFHHNQSAIKKCDTNLLSGTKSKLDQRQEEEQEELSSSEEEHLIDNYDDIDTEHEDNEYLKEHTQEVDNNFRTKSPSYFKGLHHNHQHSFTKRVLNKVSLGFLFNGNSKSHSGGSSGKYKLIQQPHSGKKTFRGSYKYSRSRISMGILKKMFSLVIQRSTLALLGAFLIHITLGTVYTLSNINSYLTSYMRVHGNPTATYGGSMWISSLYAVGQGFSMVLGGYIEKRFSAQLSCFLGCALHSISIMSTSWSIDHGSLAVLMTYGFLPGFGCGLAYMTPMSNGFGWFPNRRGFVAGVILAGFGIGTFIFNMAQTAFVNPDNLSPPNGSDGYFTQKIILDRVPHLFVFIGSIYAAMQFIGCCLLFKPPQNHLKNSDQVRPILVEADFSIRRSIRRREFIVLFLVYGVTTQGVLFVNSMIKEYGQLFIGNDMYLAWTGSMASIANSLGRLLWGLAIDRFSFTQCFTCITLIFGTLMFIMPFEFVLSSKLLYLICTLGLFGSFSGWMSTYPVHLSRVFGRTNSGMIYGLIFVSQSLGGIVSAIGAHYLIDHYNRFVPFFCVVFLEALGLAIYHLFYPK